MSKLLVTVTFEIEANPNHFPPEAQSPEEMAAFTQTQFNEGDLAIEDMLGWTSVTPVVKVEVAK
jgi:hypothetical protein